MSPEARMGERVATAAEQAMPFVHRGFARAGTVRLSYLEAGEGPPVILLHGYPQSPFEWRHLIPDLATHHRVLAFDLKGYGLSDKPPHGYDLGTLTDELRDALENLGYERAVWIGHDWGGVLVWALALRFPEIVERLVVINAPLDKVNPIRSSYVIPLLIPGLMERLLSRYNHQFVESMRLYAYTPDDLSEKTITAYARDYALPGVHHASLQYYRSLLRSGPQMFRWLARKIRRPTLVIWGIHDPALPVGLLRGIERHFEAPLTIQPIALCGHWVSDERPSEALGLIQDFVDRPTRVV